MLFQVLCKLTGGTWRLKERCRKSSIKIIKRLSRLIYTRALQEKGSWISINAYFESEPLFPHGLYGIFISGGVSIGHDCIIFQQVTIGSNTLIDSSGFGAPVIGDNCYIGAGAKIIGNVELGPNVRVGANAVVTKDVPANSVVVAPGQKMLTRDNPMNNCFYQRYKGHWRFFNRGIWREVVDENELELLKNRFPKQR